MPYPNGNIPNLAELALGVTPVTAALTALLAIPIVLSRYKHWSQIANEPHHFDTIDEGCAAMLHLNPDTAEETIQHLNDWPNADKEAARLVMVERVNSRRPLAVLWERVRGRDHTLRVEDVEGQKQLVFGQPNDPQ